MFVSLLTEPASVGLVAAINIQLLRSLMVVTVVQCSFLATNSNTLTERTLAVFGLPPHYKSHILTRSNPATVVS